MKDCTALNGSGCDGNLQNSLYQQSGNSYLCVSINRQIRQPSHYCYLRGERLDMDNSKIGIDFQTRKILPYTLMGACLEQQLQ